MPPQLNLDILERLTTRVFDKSCLPVAPCHFDLQSISTPLDVEIGCGVGMHPIRRVVEYPERTLVAIEHTKEKFDKFARRVQSHDSPRNLIPIHANAISIISQQLRDQSVDQFFLLYPNPYPKISDRKKRWPFLPFMQELLTKLKPGGCLIVATNELWYAEEMWLVMELAYAMTTRSVEKLDQNSRPRTHFEAKYLQRGEVCLNMEFVKA
jgi:tRNA (guanine-N7-)-methyltransferase